MRYTTFGDNMKVCYIVHPAFYDFVLLHPEILQNRDILEKEQRRLILKNIDKEELMRSASFFFQTSIVLDGSMLYLKDLSKKHTYFIEVHDDFIILRSDDNPFLSFLKRKFRSIFVLEEE